MCFLWQAELTFCAGDIIAVFGDIDEDGFYYVSITVVLTAHTVLFWACSTIVFFCVSGWAEWTSGLGSIQLSRRSAWWCGGLFDGHSLPPRSGRAQYGTGAAPRDQTGTPSPFSALGPVSIHPPFEFRSTRRLCVFLCLFVFSLCDRGGDFQSNLSCSRKGRSKAHCKQSLFWEHRETGTNVTLIKKANARRGSPEDCGKGQIPFLHRTMNKA